MIFKSIKSYFILNYTLKLYLIFIIIKERNLLQKLWSSIIIKIYIKYRILILLYDVSLNFWTIVTAKRSSKILFYFWDFFTFSCYCYEPESNIILYVVKIFYFKIFWPIYFKKRYFFEGISIERRAYMSVLWRSYGKSEVVFFTLLSSGIRLFWTPSN